MYFRVHKTINILILEKVHFELFILLLGLCAPYAKVELKALQFILKNFSPNADFPLLNRIVCCFPHNTVEMGQSLMYAMNGLY